MLTSKSPILLVALALACVIVAPTAMAGESPPAAKSTTTAGPAKGTTGTPNAKAVITGNAEAYAAFHQALIKYLKTSSLQDAGVGCTGCETVANDVQTQKPFRMYVFVSSPDMLGKFAAAWSEVNKRNLSLTFSEWTPPDPDCGPPKVQPCIPNGFCGDVGYCSKTFPRCVACK